MARKPNPKSSEKTMTQISISLPAKLVADIDRLADADNRNRSNYITDTLSKLAKDGYLLIPPQQSLQGINRLGM